MTSARMESGRTARAPLPLFLWVALIWMAVADVATIVPLGPVSLSGAATLFAGVLAVTLAPMLLGHGRTRVLPDPWPYATSPGRRTSVVPFPLVLFAVVALFGLLTRPSQDGVQNVAVYLAFASMLGFAAVRSRPSDAPRFLARLGWVMGVASLVSIAALFISIQVPGPRSFALTAMVAIAALVPMRTTSRFVRLAPVLLIVAIGLTYSRTALVISALLLAFILLRSRFGARGLRIALSLLLLAAATVLTFVAVPGLRDRFLEGDNAFAVGGVAVNTSGRTQIWTLVTQSALKQPWFGHGPGSASAVVSQQFPYIGHPHNDYLRLWHDFGLLGAGLFLLGYLVLLLGAVRRALRTQPKHRGPHWSAALALAAVGTAAITDNVLIYPFVMVPLGAIVGISIGRRELYPLVPTSAHARSVPRAAGSARLGSAVHPVRSGVLATGTSRAPAEQAETAR